MISTAAISKSSTFFLLFFEEDTAFFVRLFFLGVAEFSWFSTDLDLADEIFPVSTALLFFAEDVTFFSTFFFFVGFLIDCPDSDALLFLDVPSTGLFGFLLVPIFFFTALGADTLFFVGIVC